MDSAEVVDDEGIVAVEHGELELAVRAIHEDVEISNVNNRVDPEFVTIQAP